MVRIQEDKLQQLYREKVTNTAFFVMFTQNIV